MLVIKTILLTNITQKADNCYSRTPEQIFYYYGENESCELSISLSVDL